MAWTYLVFEGPSPSPNNPTLPPENRYHRYRSHLGMDGIEDGGSIHPSSVRDKLGAAGMDLGELGQVVGLPVEAKRDAWGIFWGPWGPVDYNILQHGHQGHRKSWTNPTYYILLSLS